MESLESMLEELDTPNPKESGPEPEKQPEAQEPNPQKVKEKKKKILIAVNCTPFVRQYVILNNKWGALLCQKEYRTRDILQNSKKLL